MPTDLNPRNPRQAAFGAFACLVLSCVVAPPLVRGSDSAKISDGGGCNGGRNIPINEQDDSETTTDPSSTGDTSDTTTLPGSCGDGMQDVGEVCDDGNAVDEDGCPSGAVGQCKAEAKCGDGIVWAGPEECDDGNVMAGDGCEADCTFTPAECGNGVQEPGEGCDDGNGVEEDGCPSGAVGQCKAAAVCGDGVVWSGMEGCDDGNVEDGDACPSGAAGSCLAEASCGDGFVWMGMEGCDDGNADDADACPSGIGACAAEATCGDGYVKAGVEDCDDMNAEDIDGCSNACLRPRWVFVTSGLYNGNLGGITGADAICQAAATSGGLEGTYKAWLADENPKLAPATRFASTEFKGWYLLPPTTMPSPVALGWADLTSPNEDVPVNYLRNPILTNENGAKVVEGVAWSNTNPDGTQKTTDMNCTGWTKEAVVEKGRVGNAVQGVLDMTWTDAGEDGCAGGNRLYCFQVE